MVRIKAIFCCCAAAPRPSPLQIGIEQKVTNAAINKIAQLRQEQQQETLSQIRDRLAKMAEESEIRNQLANQEEPTSDSINENLLGARIKLENQPFINLNEAGQIDQQPENREVVGVSGESLTPSPTFLRDPVSAAHSSYYDQSPDSSRNSSFIAPLPPENVDRTSLLRVTIPTSPQPDSDHSSSPFSVNQEL